MIRIGSTGFGRRIVAALFVFTFVVSGVGQERFTFSGLTIVAFGDQEIDLFTGVTTLPEGGEVIAAEQGVTITGETIRFLQGQFVEAEGVVAATEFGTARAEELRIDLTSGDIIATGELSFEHELLTLQAQGLTYRAIPGVVTFAGPVQGAGVDFEAASLLLDIESATILLVGPYRYSDGLIELSSAREGALLSLRQAQPDSTDLVASSQVAGELLERLEEFLP